MKVVFRLAIIGLLTLVYNKSYFAQGETAVPFLILAPDSRAGGIGESGSGLADNSAAIYWNPAGIAFLTGTEFSITHSNWLPQFNLDLFYEYFTYRQYFEELDGSVTSSITFMNFGEFQRTGEKDPTVLGTFRSFDAALTLGYATKLHPDWGFGMNFRLIHSRLADKGAGNEPGSGVATSVSFDVAAMWRPEEFVIPFIDENIGKQFSLGVNLANIGPKIYYINKEQADPIPTNLRLGLACQLFGDEYNSLVYTLDFQKLLVTRYKRVYQDSLRTEDNFLKAIFTSWFDQKASEEWREVVTSMGLEYVYGEPGDFSFALRGGFFYEDPSYGNRKFMTMGAGIKYDMYGFDFSYITTSVFKGGENHPLSETLRFTLFIGWGADPKSQTFGIPRGI